MAKLLINFIWNTVRNLFLIVLLSVVLSGCKDTADTTGKFDIEITVAPIVNPVVGNSSLPRLFSNGEEVYMSWVEKKDSLAILYYSNYNKESWSAPVFAAKGTDWFLNWADFPVIAKNDENLLSTYLQKSSEDTYAYDIYVRYEMPYEEDGIAIGPPRVYQENYFKLHSDTTKTEHGFVSVVPAEEEGFFLSWLDGRNTGGSSHGDHSGHGGGAMTLRAAYVDMYGEITDEIELDPRVCDCCQTSATITPNGPLVAYRDRSDEEIRDISVVRQVDGEWLEPQTIGNDNWEIAGCPVNGPSVDSFDNSVVLAWFTATGGEGAVQVVFSGDAGDTFGEPLRIDTGNATGRVDTVMLNNSEAVVLWMEPDGDDEVILLMKITSEGKKDKPITVSKTSAERASGFPQLERFGNNLMIAWTDVTGETSSIKTATLSLDKL
jgi:hypothetical protein